MTDVFQTLNNGMSSGNRLAFNAGVFSVESTPKARKLSNTKLDLIFQTIDKVNLTEGQCKELSKKIQKRAENLRSRKGIWTWIAGKNGKIDRAASQLDQLAGKVSMLHLNNRATTQPVVNAAPLQPPTPSEVLPPASSHVSPPPPPPMTSGVIPPPPPPIPGMAPPPPPPGMPQARPTDARSALQKTYENRGSDLGEGALSKGKDVDTLPVNELEAYLKQIDLTLKTHKGLQGEMEKDDLKAILNAKYKEINIPQMQKRLSKLEKIETASQEGRTFTMTLSDDKNHFQEITLKGDELETLVQDYQKRIETSFDEMQEDLKIIKKTIKESAQKYQAFLKTEEGGGTKDQLSTQLKGIKEVIYAFVALRKKSRKEQKEALTGLNAKFQMLRTSVATIGKPHESYAALLEKKKALRLQVRKVIQKKKPKKAQGSASIRASKEVSGTPVQPKMDQISLLISRRKYAEAFDKFGE